MVFWGWGRARKLRNKLVNCVVILSDKKQIIERLGYMTHLNTTFNEALAKINIMNWVKKLLIFFVCLIFHT